MHVRFDTARFRHHMYDAEPGEEVVATDPMGVNLDTAGGRSVPLPQELIERARAHAAS